MEHVYQVPMEHGYYLFKLERLLIEKKISKNKLMRDTNTDYKVLQRLMKGTMVRIDLEVMDRICHYLNCKMTDLFEYIPNSR